MALINGTESDDVLNGTAEADEINGLGGDDRIDGAAGADLMTGGLGSDWYVADDAGDTVVELAGEGALDRVFASVSYTLAAGVEVEILSTTWQGGTGAIDLYGNELNNIIAGNNGLNRLEGGDGDDTLYGHNGNDVLIGGAGADRLDGGKGGDTVDYSAAGSGVTASLLLQAASGGGGADQLLDIESLIGSAFNDVLRGGNGFNILVGGDGADRLDGSFGADSTDGGLGDDWHYLDHSGDAIIEATGEGVEDRAFASVSYVLAAGVEIEILTTTLQAGVGAIDLTGNELDNIIAGNNGVNRLNGGAGDDVIYGHNGDDVIFGGAGEDRLDGGLGFDIADFSGALAGVDVNLLTQVAVGGGETDQVRDFEGVIGSAFDDVLRGTFAGDVFEGGDGDDILHGFAGDDFLNGGLGINYLYGGDGIDTLDYSDETGALVDLRSYAQYSGRLDYLQDIENVLGTAFGDTIAGNASANRLEGFGGGDYLNGLEGADVLIGGLGDDVYTVDDVGDTVIEFAGEGFDRILSVHSFVLPAGLSIEILTTHTTALTTAINLTGNELDNVVEGNNGGNQLEGGAGADRLNGVGGDDFLYGGDGADILDGGAGTDFLSGGDGDDLYWINDALDVVTDSGGIDEVRPSFSFSLTTGDGIERMFAQTRDPLDMTGNELDNIIHGNDSHNVLVGADGDDTITGAQGNDTLEGGEGNDSLNGHQGADILIGGAGDDMMYGNGIDANVFLYNAGGSGNDRITYFKQGADKIQFVGILGVDDFSDLTITTGASGYALVTLPDGSTITLWQTGAVEMDAGDFIFGP